MRFCSRPAIKTVQADDCSMARLHDILPVFLFQALLQVLENALPER